MTLSVACFGAYDLRGRVPDELDEEIAYAIGRAYADFVQPERVVVGHDIRLSSPMLTDALIAGLLASGVQVSHIGTCGTEEIYFVTGHPGLDGGVFDGGIMVTASHNPLDYNGMKLVREGARPISGDTGLKVIQDKVRRNEFSPASGGGKCTTFDHRPAYIARLLDYVDLATLKPFKIVANPGNGGAGAVIERLAPFLPVEFIQVHFQADGSFPNGVPNPLLVENREATIAAIKHHHADLGIAWDGDFDRCFFFDEDGRFIEGYYIVGLLARYFLEQQLDQTQPSVIIHDPRLVWNTQDIVRVGGGTAVQSKTGHAFIKERMRQENAVYGGEMSAHHYFRDFAFCDSGMVPWLLVLALMSREDKKLSELVDERMAMYPVSGEINRRVEHPDRVLADIERRYGRGNGHQQAVLSVDHTDGLSMEFADWRFNVRASNTEPVVRLNVESRANPDLMQEKTRELLLLLGEEDEHQNTGKKGHKK